MDDKWLNRDYSSVQKDDKKSLNKIVKYALILCFIVACIDSLIKLNNYDSSDYQSHSQNINWSNPEEVGDFVEWTSKKQQERQDSEW